MDENIPPSELGRQLARRSAEIESECQSEFSLIQRGDLIKPGWWHWRCRREDGAGNVFYGYVRADSLGRVVAPESFESD